MQAGGESLQPLVNVDSRIVFLRAHANSQWMQVVCETCPRKQLPDASVFGNHAPERDSCYGKNQKRVSRLRSNREVGLC